MPQGTGRPSPYLASDPPTHPVLGSLAGDVLILHMPLIIPPPFVCVQSQNYRTAALALVWSCASSFCVVRRASLIGNVWQAPIYFYCFILAARKRAFVFLLLVFFYSPLVYNVR